ncbi:MAG: TetR/AcrR family transcriptional regulator [Acidimicrobiales bacterium]
MQSTTFGAMRMDFANNGTPLRKDALATRLQLLEGVGRLLEHRGIDFNLSDVAREAGCSIATAYRHFNDKADALEQVIETFSSTVLDRAETLADLEPRQRLEGLCRVWVETALQWGPAAVYLRSPLGVLHRFRAGNPLLARVMAATSEILRSLMESGHLPEQDVEYASFVWITLFDERNIVDLHHAAGWSEDVINERLTATLLAALGAGSSWRA